MTLILSNVRKRKCRDDAVHLLREWEGRGIRLHELDIGPAIPADSFLRARQHGIGQVNSDDFAVSSYFVLKQAKVEPGAAPYFYNRVPGL